MKITYFSLCILFITLVIDGEGIKNPGMLLQIPDDMKLPTVLTILPYQIASGITIQKLQLTDVNLRNLDYSWKLLNNQFDVSIPEAVISFHWYYGQDSGIGTFTETHLGLKIVWEPTMDSHNRFKINILSTKIINDEKRSKITINLGGDVKQTVAVEVTNLILNHAKITFQSGITNALISAANSLTSILASDFKIYCPEQKPCIYLNTTLTTTPIKSNSTIIIQINGAPYQSGKSSQDFEPSSMLFKSQSKEISFQIHKQIGSKILQIVNQISPFSKTIDSTQISSVTDLNSQTFSMIFPKMREYGKPRSVLFIIDVLKLELGLTKGQSVNVMANISASIATLTNGDLTQQSPYPYSRPSKASLQISILPIIRKNVLGARISKISMNDIKFDEADIAQGFILPDQIIRHLDTLLTWAAGGVNGGLNEKTTQIQFIGFNINPVLTILSESVAIDINFQQKKDHINMNDQ